MKCTLFIFALMLVCALGGCSSKKAESKTEETQIFQVESIEENSEVKRIQESHINHTFTCKGKEFKLQVDRVPDNSLPLVKSEMGVFLDNRINVKILHANGRSLFTKSFSKKDFEAHLPAEFLSHSVLEGIVFDDVKTDENKEITLAASVSYPMTDLYVPFTLVVSQSGTLSLAKDEDMGELTPLGEEE